jgi:hypothetical protein
MGMRLRDRGAGLGLALALLAGAGAAHAQGLSNKVYSPYVEKGVTELELRAGRLNGGPLDGESAAVLELEQGINDRLSLAVLGEVERHAGEKSKLDAVAVEGVYYLGQIPGLGVDVGGYLEYEQRIHNESGVLEGKLLFAKRQGRFEGLVNVIVERPLSDKAGEHDAQYGYAAQATFETLPGLKLGVQAFGDLGTDRSFGGRQAHYLGPVANWTLHPRWMRRGELELEAAWLAPAGTARDNADSQLRLMVEFERRF